MYRLNRLRVACHTSSLDYITVDVCTEEFETYLKLPTVPSVFDLFICLPVDVSDDVILFIADCRVDHPVAKQVILSCMLIFIV